jgi:hypothetical protein
VSASASASASASHECPGGGVAHFAGAAHVHGSALLRGAGAFARRYVLPMRRCGRTRLAETGASV